jgi:hypothetical protein
MNNKTTNNEQQRADFIEQTTALMQRSAPREFALMSHFCRESIAFATLHEKVINLHFYGPDGEALSEQQRSPEFCAKGLTRLVERLLATIENTAHKAA